MSIEPVYRCRTVPSFLGLSISSEDFGFSGAAAKLLGVGYISRIESADIVRLPQADFLRYSGSLRRKLA